MLVAGLHGEITQRADADEAFLAIKDSEGANLPCSHRLRRLLYILIFEAVSDAGRHYVPDRCRCGIASVAHAPHHDVSVGHNPYQSVVFANRQAAYIQVFHPVGGILERLVWADAFRRLGHYFLYRHDVPPEVLTLHLVSPLNSIQAGRSLAPARMRAGALLDDKPPAVVKEKAERKALGKNGETGPKLWR
jgi:hypothetical protein